MGRCSTGDEGRDSNGTGRPDGTSGSNGIGGSDGEGWLTLIAADVIETVWVNERLKYFKMLSKSSSKREHVRKDLLEKAKEDNKMQYEEKHKSHALKLKKEMAKETNAKISWRKRRMQRTQMFAQ
ncbi:hypothetical protein Tco_1238958 [Tanacetum coccineum]